MKIDKNIPIPSLVGQPRPDHKPTPVSYPFAAMEPGDSILITPFPHETVEQLRLRVSLAVDQFQNLQPTPWVMPTRGEAKGYRVWRRSIPEPVGRGRPRIYDFGSIPVGGHLLIEPRPGETPHDTRKRASAALYAFTLKNPGSGLGVRTTERGAVVTRS